MNVVRFGILGPVKAWRGAAALPVGSMKHELVLSTLLLRANEPVDRDEIVETVWGRRAPKSSTNLVQKYVGDVRRALEPDGWSMLVSSGRKYRLDVLPEQLDSHSFQEHLALARTAREQSDYRSATAALHEALDLWRGQAWSDLETVDAVAERSRLDELRAVAREELAELALLRGEMVEAVAELSRLVVEYPLRERLRMLHMIVLYRLGRQAEALSSYRAMRALLDEELGVEPSPSLQRLHQRILSRDTRLDDQLAPADMRLLAESVAGGRTDREAREHLAVFISCLLAQGAHNPDAMVLTVEQVEEIARRVLRESA
jgi:DNA-binding SARP family transcriptional activator